MKKRVLICLGVIAFGLLAFRPLSQKACIEGLWCPRPEARAAVRSDSPLPKRPVNTFSIVARDPQTGEMGVAVQSHWFSVGSIVAWAESGVGAVATQSLVDPAYGPLGLDLMRLGKSAPEAALGLLNSDPNNNVRQVAMVDPEGRVLSFTGCKAIRDAGGQVGAKQSEGTIGPGGASGQKAECVSLYQIGRDYGAQANLMANDTVWPAMAKAFESAKGDLAERMLAALDAAQSVGGDIRGKQSAAIVVVKAKSSGKPWQDRVFDLRVDDHLEPLKELRRLVTVQRAYNHMNAGDLAVEHKDKEGALREYSAAEKLAQSSPDIPPSRLAEMQYWHAVALVNMGRVEESLPLFAKAFATEPGWRELTPRLPKSGLLPADPKILQRIVAAK